MRRPRRTLRLRLTLLYGGVFLLAAVALLAAIYLLAAHSFGDGDVFAQQARALPRPVGQPESSITPPQAHAVSTVARHTLLTQSLLALPVAAVLSFGLGWLVAGRALEPLRAITDAAREISAYDLHRRLTVETQDDEIGQLGATFNDLLTRLETAFEAQRRFVANASHELRTPLTLQRTVVQVALADPDASIESLREMGEDVLAAGDRHEKLIDALLTLSRSHGGLDRRDPVDLATVVADTLRRVEGHELVVEAVLEPASTVGDRSLIERLAMNLVENAVRHNRPHGNVAVATRVDGGRALLTVTNTGPPVAAGELARLFQPFQRLDDHRASTGEGLGLGLSIVDAIAVAHEAAVAARPNPGGGLHVEVSFPALAIPPTGFEPVLPA